MNVFALNCLILDERNDFHPNKHLTLISYLDHYFELQEDGRVETIKSRSPLLNGNPKPKSISDFKKYMKSEMRYGMFVQLAEDDDPQFISNSLFIETERMKGIGLDTLDGEGIIEKLGLDLLVIVRMGRERNYEEFHCRMRNGPTYHGAPSGFFNFFQAL